MNKTSMFLALSFSFFFFIKGEGFAKSPYAIATPQGEKRQYKEEQIAVLDFAGDVDNWVKQAFVEKLEAHIAGLERFTVVSRRNIQQALEELALSQTGIFADDQALEVGRFLAARKIIVGRVNYVDVRWNSKAELYDAQISITGKLIEVERAEVFSGSGIDVAGSGTNEKKRMTILEAVEEAVTNFILELREIFPLEAQIISVENGNTIVNMGKLAGLETGMLFEVYRTGETIVDPVTGESLGREEDEVGLIGIIEAKPKFARGRILKGRYRITKGDRIKEAAKLRYPSFNLAFSYTHLPARGKPNTLLLTPANEGITKAQSYYLRLFYQSYVSTVGIGVDVAAVDAGPVGGLGFGVLIRKRISLIPELLDIYLRGSLSYSLMTQEIPNMKEVFSELNIDSEDTFAEDWVLGYSAAIGMSLSVIKLVKTKGRLFKFFEPFAEITYEHFNELNDWKVERKTGKKDKEGKDITEKVRIPDQYLPYPSLRIGGLSFRFGLVLIGFSW